METGTQVMETVRDTGDGDSQTGTHVMETVRQRHR